MSYIYMRNNQSCFKHVFHKWKILSTFSLTFIKKRNGAQTNRMSNVYGKAHAYTTVLLSFRQYQVICIYSVKCSKLPTACATISYVIVQTGGYTYYRQYNKTSKFT